MQTYHDEEWGVPERDSRALWEMLMLEGFQAGLAWITVLRKREAFRKAFAGFDPAKVARFDEARRRSPDGQRRNHPRPRQDRGDDRAARGSSARCAIAARISASFCWSFTDGKVVKGDGRAVPAQTAALRRHLQGAETPRIQVRRPDDRLCLDAGRRHRQRPFDCLLPSASGR